MKPLKKQTELPEMLGLRLEAEPRYLLELAARIDDCSSSDVVRKALELFYATAVSPRLLAEFEEAYANDGLPSPAMIQARKTQAQRMQMEHPLAAYKHLLWAERPFDRVLRLRTYFPHLLTELDVVLLDYLMQDQRYSKPVQQGRAYMIEAINTASWEQLQAEAFAWNKNRKDS